MASPLKPWEMSPLQNSAQFMNTINSIPGPPQPGLGRSAPVLPPPPSRAIIAPPTPTPYSSFMQPYGNGYNTLGYGGYGTYGMPYRNSMYGSAYGGYGMDDAERRFIQYAEERSRHAFANVENVVRVFNSISMMLDNTFFAMTSSFRAVLSVADNFGKLRNMFGQIWYSVNLYRIFHYLYRKLMWLLGRKVPSNSVTAAAWQQANEHANGGVPHLMDKAQAQSSWPTFAFLGLILSAPYIISKFLPKYEDKRNPTTWQTPGIPAKAAFDFTSRGATEMSFRTNDILTLAPTSIQEEMGLVNSGWAYAVANNNPNGAAGLVPISYLLIIKNQPIINNISPPTVHTYSEYNNNSNTHKNNNNNNNNHQNGKNHTKRVSFGETQIFENVDLEDYVTGKKELTSKKSDHKIATETNNNNNSNNTNNNKYISA